MDHRRFHCAILFALVTATLNSAAAEPLTPIELSDLPAPPAGLASLVARTPLTWQSGQRDDAGQPIGVSKLAGETKYVARYSFACRKRWRYEPTTSRVQITLRYTRVDWHLTHQIWLRERPADDRFWSDRIVLHELDHLRISSDPRNGRRFEARLREQTELELEVDNNDTVNRAYVDQAVEDHVRRIFLDHTELIKIRYRELDRVTLHGLRPVPIDSPLARQLKRASQPEGELSRGR